MTTHSFRTEATTRRTTTTIAPTPTTAPTAPPVAKPVQARERDCVIRGECVPKMPARTLPIHNHLSLPHDGQFKKLPAEVRALVLDRMEEHARPDDPSARQSYAQLATEPAFQKLSLEHQRALVLALEAKPGRASVGRDLVRLVQRQSFRDLGDSTKSELIDALARSRDNPTGRQSLLRLANEPAFAQLADGDKVALLRIGGGSDPRYSGALRTAIDGEISSAAYQRAPETEKTAKLRALMEKQEFLPRATTAADGTFDAIRKPYHPNPLVGTAIPGTNQTLYKVTIEGKEFPIKVSPPPAGMVHYKPEEMAEALAAVPKKARDLITEVTFEPNQRGSAYMASNSTGRIWVYPGTAPRESPTFMASAVLHETGHIVSGRAFGDDTNDARWDTWKNAMKLDRLSPSKYGHTTPGQDKTAAGGTAYADDFAEFTLLYGQTKGTAAEAEVKRLFPVRWATFETM